MTDHTALHIDHARLGWAHDPEDEPRTVCPECGRRGPECMLIDCHDCGRTACDRCALETEGCDWLCAMCAAERGL